MYFAYGEQEVNYLRKRDKRLARVIDQVGVVRREVDPDLFSSVVHHIVGQQISTKAQATVWRRVREDLGTVSAETVLSAGEEQLRGLGLSGRKVSYVMDFARRVCDGSFDVDAVRAMADEEAVAALSSLKGVGVWTAEMILLFCLQRSDVFSYGDLAIHRGLRMVYRHREIGLERFDRYRRRFSPCGSVASLYLWAVAGGEVPGLWDPAAQAVAKGKRAERGAS